jgi:hypothetical protein
LRRGARSSRLISGRRGTTNHGAAALEVLPDAKGGGPDRSGWGTYAEERLGDGKANETIRNLIEENDQLRKARAGATCSSGARASSGSLFERHGKVAEIIRRHRAAIHAEISAFDKESLNIDEAGDKAEIARQVLGEVVDQLRGFGVGARMNLAEEEREERRMGWAKTEGVASATERNLIAEMDAAIAGM